MAASGSDTVSVVDRTRPITIGSGIVAVHFLGRTAAFVLGEEAIVLAPAEGEPRRLPIHGGAILNAAADGKRVVTGGDDGKIVATDVDGASTVLASDPKQRWIDHVALGPDGVVAWSAGKIACVQAKDLRTFEAPSTVGGVAAFANGAPGFRPAGQAAGTQRTVSGNGAPPTVKFPMQTTGTPARRQRCPSRRPATAP